MMVAFPSSPSVGQQYLQWVWDGIKWAAAPTSVPGCGRFGIVGSSPATQVAFKPFKGDLVKHNGIIRQIPSAGVIASASSAYINGVLGALASGTSYFVYLFDVGGSLALDFSTTGHATSTTPGNVGVEIKTGDDTRTLVGFCQLSASQFYDGSVNRLTRSWFNRPSAQLTTGQVSWSVGVTAWFALGQIAASYCAFADDVLFCSHDGQVNNSGGPPAIMAIGIGTSVTLYMTTTVTATNAGYYCPVSVAYAAPQQEGVSAVYGWAYNNGPGTQTGATGIVGILTS